MNSLSKFIILSTLITGISCTSQLKRRVPSNESGTNNQCVTPVKKALEILQGVQSTIEQQVTKDLKEWHIPKTTCDNIFCEITFPQVANVEFTPANIARLTPVVSSFYYIRSELLFSTHNDNSLQCRVRLKIRECVPETYGTALKRSVEIDCIRPHKGKIESFGPLDDISYAKMGSHIENILTEYVYDAVESLHPENFNSSSVEKSFRILTVSPNN